MTARTNVAIYSRVSTDHQTTQNQLLELRAYAYRMGYRVVAEICDDGISGRIGRNERLGYNRLLQMISRREIDIVLCWAVDRVSRSLVELVCFLNELKAKQVDIVILNNGVDTTTPGGRALFGMLAVFSELENALLKERIHAGLNRARAEGKKLGRPSVADSPQLIASVKLLREKEMPIHHIARNLRIGVGTVQKILKAA